MSRRTQRNIGVIGLGIIGQRVSQHLRRQGFPVFVWNRTPRPLPNFVGSPAEVAQLADFIQIFVSDDEALLEIVEQLKMTLKAHHVVMAHCTVAPHTMRAAAEIVQRRGAQFLDAPFTGSKVAAEKGELVYYIGGDESAFRRAKQVLEASSKEIIEIGEIGQATTIKVATNMITAATVQVAAEALAVVQNAGMAAEKFAVAMRGNASNSVTLTMKLPKMIAGDFDPHFSVKHMLKDVEIATRLARSHGLSLGATEAARKSLLEEMRHDRGDYDFTSLVRVIIPPAKEPEQPEITVSDHPMLDLREAAPREKTVPLQEEPAVLPEPLPPAEDRVPGTADERAAESAGEELKLIEDKSAEAKDQSADLPTAAPAQPEEKETLEPKSEIVGESLEERIGLSMRPEEREGRPEEPVEARHEMEQRELPEEELEIAEEAAQVSLKPKSEPEVDHLVLSEHDSKVVDGERERLLEEKGKDDEAAEEITGEPTVEKPAAEATSPDAAPSATEEEKAEPEEARRGFFSRLFSTTSHEKDPDY